MSMFDLPTEVRDIILSKNDAWRAELSALLRRHRCLVCASAHDTSQCECVLVRRTSPGGRTALFLIEKSFRHSFYVCRLRNDMWTPEYTRALSAAEEAAMLEDCDLIRFTYHTLPKPIVLSTHEKYEVFGVRNGSTTVRTFEDPESAARDLVSALREFYM